MAQEGCPGIGAGEEAIAHLRIEYPSQTLPGQRLSLAVPDVATALVVAQINRPDGAVELWDGDRQIAVLCNQSDTHSPLWRVN